MSHESNNFHEGFFARTIRDALSSLPNATSEHPALPLEQQLYSVVEHPESTASNNQSNSKIKTPAHMASENTITSAPHNISLPASPPQASVASKFINTAAQTSPRGDQQALTDSAIGISAAPVADKTTTHFPRNTRALAALQPRKKIPLAITMRDSNTLTASAQNHRYTVTKRAQAPVQTLATQTPTGDTLSNALTNAELAKVESIKEDSQRQTLPVALAPVIAESAPVLSGQRLPERKTQVPTLRIGAVTIRVVDAASDQTTPSRAGQPVTTPIVVDPIANAESRHFLRTL